MEYSLDMGDLIRVSGSMDYGQYAECLDQLLEWKILDYNADFGLFDPRDQGRSFEAFGYLESARVGRVPIYAVPFTTDPCERDDLFDRLAKSVIKGRHSAALLLYRAPQVREQSGRWFGFYGWVLKPNSQKWWPLMLNLSMRGNGVDAVFDNCVPSQTDTDHPPPSLEDKNAIMAASIALALEGYVGDKEPRYDIHIVERPSGWGIFDVNNVTSMLSEMFGDARHIDHKVLH